MAYTHGVYIYENPTSVVAPLTADSGVQFIVGTAPVNLLPDPTAAVNVPILVNSFAEAVQKVGYSDNFEKFTVCQSIDASFRVFNVAPLVIVNVLDPTKHTTEVLNENHLIVNRQVVIEEEGILLEGLQVKESSGTTVYELDKDYELSFNASGYVVVKILEDGDIPDEATELSISYTQLDPSQVTEEDIIGGYDAATGKYTGLENIGQVFPRLGIVPGLIVCPGWSHKPAVGVAMSAKCEAINGSFNCQAVKDVDTTAETGANEYSKVNTWKNNNSYTGKHDIVCWPMAKIADKKYYFSALEAALIAYTDAQNENVPFVSPSNKRLPITGTILADGTEVYLDQVQGNLLNGQGIITAININGWRSWGNNTGVYPSSTDVKDRFISVRRMFDWWGNSFILTYFQKVDDPLNLRLIEAIVDSENIRANGYKARYQIADARIEFLADQNPTTDLLNGTIRFNQYLTPYPPAETIINVLEFDPDALRTALGI